MKDFKCKRCGHNNYYKQEKGNHLGVYCSLCDKWFKWIKQSEVDCRGNDIDLEY
jgi:transcription elongation factor Elf1